ncbi:Uncharacterised protein [uncultured archaeon]|nr:Uncharacterised protein [uncultured archaeon]
MLDAVRCSSSHPLQSIFPLLKNSGASATLVEPGAIFSFDHLLLAAALAEKSIKDGTAVSDRPEMEFLLWLACTPHAKKAIGLAGAKSEKDFVLVVLGDGKKGAPNARALAKKLGLDENKKNHIGSETALSFFSVSSAELLYEKMALSRL